MSEIIVRNWKGWFPNLKSKIGFDVLYDCNNIRIYDNQIQSVKGWKYLRVNNVFIPNINHVAIYPLLDKPIGFYPFKLVYATENYNREFWLHVIIGSKRVYYLESATIYLYFTLKDISDFEDPNYDEEATVADAAIFGGNFVYTDNLRRPKIWDGITEEVQDLGGDGETGLHSSILRIIRAGTVEANNGKIILGNLTEVNNVIDTVSEIIDGIDSTIDSYLAVPEIGGSIDSQSALIDTVSTNIDEYGSLDSANLTQYKSDVIWCDPDNINDWVPTAENQAGRLSFDDDPYEIIKIKKLGFNDINAVYKSGSIWLLVEVGRPFIYAKRFVTDVVGLIATNAISSQGEFHYFLGTDFNIYKFNGSQLTNLTYGSGISEYIKNTHYPSKIKTAYSFVDLKKKEIHFVYEHKDSAVDMNLILKYIDIVYNYEQNVFTKRDTSGSCAGLLDRFQSAGNPSTSINGTSDIVDSLSSDIDQPGTERSIVILDQKGYIYYWDEGDSFYDGEFPMDFKLVKTYFYTGLEAFKKPNLSKVINRTILELDDYDLMKHFELSIGKTRSLDMPIVYNGPFKKLLNNSNKGNNIKCRTIGQYLNLKFEVDSSVQFNMSGYIIEIEPYGEIIR